MGRGGMRWGAGRPAWRPKAEACLRLDVRDLARRKMLNGGSFGWHWSETHSGRWAANIGIEVKGEVVRLDYLVSGEVSGHDVHLARTACGFGGSRPWFLCPRCGSRVAVLFMRSRTFVCRRCSGVAYTSQSEDTIGRAWRRQAKLERRLGKNWARPKGMHHATRARLMDRIFACEMERDDAIAAFLARFPGLAL